MADCCGHRVLLNEYHLWPVSSSSLNSYPSSFPGSLSSSGTWHDSVFFCKYCLLYSVVVSRGPPLVYGLPPWSGSTPRSPVLELEQSRFTSLKSMHPGSLGVESGHLNHSKNLGSPGLELLGTLHSYQSEIEDRGIWTPNLPPWSWNFKRLDNRSLGVGAPWIYHLRIRTVSIHAVEHLGSTISE